MPVAICDFIFLFLKDSCGRSSFLIWYISWNFPAKWVNAGLISTKMYHFFFQIRTMMISVILCATDLIYIYTAAPVLLQNLAEILRIHYNYHSDLTVITSETEPGSKSSERQPRIYKHPMQPPAPYIQKSTCGNLPYESITHTLPCVFRSIIFERRHEACD